MQNFASALSLVSAIRSRAAAAAAVPFARDEASGSLVQLGAGVFGLARGCPSRRFRQWCMHRVDLSV